MNLKINKQTLNQFTIIYISVPLLIFLITWLKPYIAIFSFILFIYAIYSGYFKNNKLELNNLINSKKFFLIILVISFLWCYFAGLGGFWYQSFDHHWRNAIFRDLINYSWPVYYETIDAAMVYYIGYWLPAALFAKLFSSFSYNFSFFIGNVFLLLYSIIGVILVFLHIFKNIIVKRYYKILLVIFVFIFFSGLDIVGVAYPFFYDINKVFDPFHLEWWSPFIGQYSSNTTVLFWCFNQGIPAWLLTLMFYNNRKEIENFGLLAVLCFFCAPLPFVGLSLFIIIYLIKNFFTKYKKNKVFEYLKRIFSASNVISVFFITPIIFLYFLSNKIVSGENNSFGIMYQSNWPFFVILLYFFIFIYFVLIEALIYLMLIYKQYKKNIIYYACFISLFLIPLVKIGSRAEFCMRGSIPALIILYLMIVKFIIRKYNLKRNKIKYLFLCLCLFLGTITPIVEFTRGIKNVVDNKTIFRKADNFITFEGKKRLFIKNFIAYAPKDKTFFKYLTKK